VFHQN